MASKRVLSVVLAAAMFLTLIAIAAVGIGETTALGFSPTRSAAALAQPQVIAMTMHRGAAPEWGAHPVTGEPTLRHGNMVASTRTLDMVDTRITNEWDLDAIDITRGRMQDHNERWRWGFADGDGVFNNNYTIWLWRLTAAREWDDLAGNPNSPVWTNPTLEASWVPLCEYFMDRWDVSVHLTVASRVWAGLNLTAVNAGLDGANQVTLRLDTHPTIVATGSLSSTDRVEARVSGRRVSGGNRSILILRSEAHVGGRESIISTGDDVIIFMNNVNSRRIRVLEFINRATIYTEFDGIITTRLHQRDYYIQVASRATDAQRDIMDQFSFEMFRSLTHIGLPATATITWEFGFNYWVYSVIDGNLVFLGRSNQELPLVEAYFFSAVELEIVDAPIEEPDDYLPPADGGPTGPVGPNYNPPTGR